jgi:hypothetical protein
MIVMTYELDASLKGAIDQDLREASVIPARLNNQRNLRAAGARGRRCARITARRYDPPAHLRGSCGSWVPTTRPRGQRPAGFSGNIRLEMAELGEHRPIPPPCFRGTAGLARPPRPGRPVRPRTRACPGQETAAADPGGPALIPPPAVPDGPCRQPLRTGRGKSPARWFSEPIDRDNSAEADEDRRPCKLHITRRAKNQARIRSAASQAMPMSGCCARSSSCSKYMLTP